MADTPPTSFIHPDTFWRDLGLQAGQTIVHLGCGPGFYLIPAAKIVGQLGKAIGVDILPHLLEEVESRAQREHVTGIIHTIRANLEASQGSTLPPDSADWVLVANILHQSDPAKILVEAQRIGKANGTIIVVDWDTIATPLGPPPDQRVAKPHVLDVAQAANLKLVREFQPSPYHYGLIFSKSAS